MGYDAKSTVTTPDKVETRAVPQLGDVLDQVVAHTFANLRVCLPAKIVKVRGPQFVDAQPLLKQYAQGKEVDYPVVTGALVSMPIGQMHGIFSPLEAGDTGLLLFCDRALTPYAAGDGRTAKAPDSPRSHNITDAIFLPGLLPIGSQTQRTTDIRLINGIASLEIAKDGKFAIGNGVHELVDLVGQLSAQVAELAKALSLAMPTTGWAYTPQADAANVMAQTTQIASHVKTLRKD